MATNLSKNTEFQPGRESVWRDEAPAIADGECMDLALRLLGLVQNASVNTGDLLTSPYPAEDLKRIRRDLSQALALTDMLDCRLRNITLEDVVPPMQEAA